MASAAAASMVMLVTAAAPAPASAHSAPFAGAGASVMADNNRLDSSADMQSRGVRQKQPVTFVRRVCLRVLVRTCARS